MRTYIVLLPHQLGKPYSMMYVDVYTNQQTNYAKSLLVEKKKTIMIGYSAEQQVV